MPIPEQRELNLIGTSCPMAFVKARLFLDQCTSGEIVTILFEYNAANEPLVRSITALGHTIVTDQVELAKKAIKTGHNQNSLSPDTLEIELKRIEVQVKIE